MLNFLQPCVEKAVFKLLEDLSTPTALKVKLLMAHGEWDQLALCKFDPNNYLDPETAWRDNQALGLLRKMRELPTSIDRKAAAEETFLKCEESCFRANLRLLPYLSPGFPDTSADVCQFFSDVREKVAFLLGSFPSDLDGRFGPGATFGDRGRCTTVPDKMSSEPTFTPDAWPYLINWVGTQWASACASSGKDPSRVPGNRFTTVPKDCTKDRGIAVEPSINVFYQLGVGKAIRKRLIHSVGLDLRESQEKHRQVVCTASYDGRLATMDLSNASDTICSNLVKLLLPPSWFTQLDALRSKKTLFRKKWVLLEKFSSMGNGFTFELETVIFLSLVWALNPSLIPGVDLFVYGDDLIFPSSMSKDVAACFSFLGLTPNMKKTFSTGLFRESCGGDFFNGVPVRAYSCDESPSEPQQLISFANGLLASCQRIPAREAIVYRARRAIIDGLPYALRGLRGPRDLGDLLLHDDNESKWTPRWRSGIRYFKVYRPARHRKVSWHHFRPDVVLASATYGLGWGNGGVTPRDSVLGYKVGWVARS